MPKGRFQEHGQMYGHNNPYTYLLICIPTNQKYSDGHVSIFAFPGQEPTGFISWKTA